MAELHKFQDDVRTTEGKSKPMASRHLDENFEKVKLEIASNLSGFLRIKDNSPKPSEIEFVTPPPSDGNQYAPVFAGGQFSQWMKISECP